MAFAYLIDPENQFMTKSGTINVDGFLKVFDAATDDPAVTYKDFSGTENPERITLDNNGRAVVIADAERAYRLEVYDRYGTLMWTTTPLWCLPGGGGADLMNIISSDYSIAVDKTTVGSLTTFDLTVAKDSTEMLEWLKTEGYTSASGTMVPTYHEGTMQVGQRGIIMHADHYYHVTARLATSTQLQPLYNEFNLTFKGIDAEDNVYTFRDDRLIIDCSTELHQDFEVSFDIIPETDIELYADVTGLAYGVSVGLTDVQVHRVYSGAPSVPDSVATRTWVEEHFQEILSGGPGIELSGNYIAVDFDDVQQKLQEGEGINIVGDTISVDFTEVQQKLEAGANIDITGNVISAIVPEYANADWDATSGEPGYIANKPDNLVQDADYVHTDNNFSDSDKSKLDSIEEGAQVNVNSDWDATSGEPGFIENKPDLSQYATQTDLADKQDVLTAGDNITIVNNVISATAAPQLNADWDATSGVQEILHKPDLSQYATQTDLAGKQDTLTAGSNITIVNDVISATAAPQVNADWDATSGVAEILHKPNIPTATSDLQNDSGFITLADVPAGQVNADWDATSGVQEILNKPDLSVYATQTDLAGKQDTLTAGSNITITNNVISAAADPQVNADWDATSGVAEILNKPVIPTSTSDLQNNSGFITLADVPSGQVNSDWDATSGVAEILNKPTLKALEAGANITITEGVDTVVIAAAASAQLNADWDATSGVQEILNKPDLSQYATQSDLSGKQDTLTAGSNITITNNVISATAAPQVNADWDATSGVSEILHKPDLSVYATQSDLSGKQDTLTAGSNITITNDVISAAAQLNADWDAVSGVQEILNKPTIPPLSTLIAGSNITLSEGIDGVTISATGAPVIGHITV